MSIHLKPCWGCDHPNSVDYLTSPLLRDGKRYRHTICYSCSEGMNHNVLYCPECDSPYECESSWRHGDYNDHSVMQSVPCPQHSKKSSHPAVECAGCKNVVNSNYTMTNRGAWLCHTCSYSETVHCFANYCGTQLTPTMDGVVSSVAGNRHYCGDCSTVKKVPIQFGHPLAWDYSHTCLCTMCAMLRGRSDRWPDLGEELIPDVMCSRCQNFVGNGDGMIVHPGGGFHCHSCLTHMDKCEVCEEYRFPSQFHRTGYPSHHTHRNACDICMMATDKWMCTVQCKRWFPMDAHCSCGGVHPWNYEPEELNFLVGRGQSSEAIMDRWQDKASGKIPFFGLEIEVEAHKGGATRAGGAAIVRNHMGDIGWVMHDGSLKGDKANGTGGDYGFEFVTHPFTYQWLHENWWRFEAMLAELAAKGYRSWEGGRCGIHIHVSREPMTEAHQMKFIRFIYGFTNLMMCIGQRGYTDKNLAKFASFDVENRNQLITKIRNNANPGASGHYTAVNTMKSATIEGRWFRGTLNPLAVRKNIELMDAMWWFTKKFGFSSANEINFIGWLRGPREQSKYATLLNYIEHNYITRR